MLSRVLPVTVIVLSDNNKIMGAETTSNYIPEESRWGSDGVVSFLQKAYADGRRSPEETKQLKEMLGIASDTINLSRKEAKKLSQEVSKNLEQNHSDYKEGRDSGKPQYISSLQQYLWVVSDGMIWFRTYFAYKWSPLATYFSFHDVVSGEITKTSLWKTYIRSPLSLVSLRKAQKKLENLEKKYGVTDEKREWIANISQLLDEKNMTREGIKTLQELINEKTEFSISVDGILGMETIATLYTLQNMSFFKEFLSDFESYEPDMKENIISTQHQALLQEVGEISVSDENLAVLWYYLNIPAKEEMSVENILLSLHEKYGELTFAKRFVYYLLKSENPQKLLQELDTSGIDITDFTEWKFYWINQENDFVEVALSGWESHIHEVDVASQLVS